jgi:hypothetical protein
MYLTVYYSRLYIYIYHLHFLCITPFTLVYLISGTIAIKSKRDSRDLPK